MVLIYYDMVFKSICSQSTVCGVQFGRLIDVYVRDYFFKYIIIIENLNGEEPWLSGGSSNIKNHAPNVYKAFDNV